MKEQEKHELEKLLGNEPMNEYGRRADQKMYSTERRVNMERILSELEEEPCEQCGTKTRECGPLFIKNSKDDKGRNIVLQVCSKCLKTTKKRRTG